VDPAGKASCICDGGYHADGLACVEDESCAGVDCGYCGQCKVQEGVATCVCPDGFQFNGSRCEIVGDPCASVTCGPGKACVPAHHCTIDPLCMDTCDCSNCGNCDMGDFGGSQVKYCGSSNYPATMACTDPCPSGSGCIPFSQPICWPGQGCMSQ
jgi:hypothetical protein